MFYFCTRETIRGVWEESCSRFFSDSDRDCADKPVNAHSRLVIWVKYRCRRRKCRMEIDITRHGYLPWWRGRKQSTEAYLHPKMIGFAVPWGNLVLSPTIPHFRALSCMRFHYRLVAAKSWPIKSHLFSFASVKMGKMAHGRMQADFPLKTAQQMSIDVAVEGKTPALGREIRL